MRTPSVVDILRPILAALQPSAYRQPRPVREEVPMSEAVLQQRVLAHLQQLAPRAFFWRANTGGARTSQGFIRFGIPGQADILGTAAGHFIAIELKTPEGRQSVAQRAFAARVTDAGGVYVLARSVDEALDPVLALLGR